MMISRLATGLIFSAFGALATVAMFAIQGEGVMPPNVVVLIPIFAVAAAMMGAVLSHKFATPFRFYALLMGAMTMMMAQIPFALMAMLWFGVTEPDGGGASFTTFGQLVVGGWGFAAPYQVVAGALAGWLVHRLSGLPVEDESP